MMYKLLNLNNSHLWKNYLNKLPVNQQDVYYTPEYYSIYEKNGDGKAQCFLFEQNGEIALYPFLINSVNELGYELDNNYFDIQGAYGYNGVISTTNEAWFINEFYNSFNLYCRENNIIAEFTRFHPVLNNHRFSEQNLNVVFDRKTVFLDITKNYNEIWTKEYSGNNRNMIRKAEKSGVKSLISQNEEDYLKFFELYHETMQNVGATVYYFFSEKYFKNMRMGLKDNLYLIFSKINDEFVGGMILFIYGDYAHYHLSARKKEFGKYAINNHFLDYAIKVAKKQGCKLFHFGGGTNSNENNPLFKFKSNFSSQRGEFYFGKKIHNIEIYNQVVNQWAKQNPEKIEQFKNQLLKYRN